MASLAPPESDAILYDRSSSYDAIVTVRNKSALPESFAIFPEAPTFSPAAVPRVFVSVYQASLRVAPQTGSTTFVMTFPDASSLSVFAVTGVARTKMQPELRIFSSDYVRLQASADLTAPSASCTMTMPDGSEPSFVPRDKGNPGYNATDDQDGDANHSGRVRINVDHSFSYPHSTTAEIADGPSPGVPFVGIGACNPYNQDEVIPIVTWEAVPGTVYVFSPSLDWRCTRGQAVAGEILDLEVWQPQATIPSLERRAVREVHYQSNGQFDVIQAGSLE